MIAGPTHWLILQLCSTSCSGWWPAVWLVGIWYCSTAALQQCVGYLMARMQTPPTPPLACQLAQGCVHCMHCAYFQHFLSEKVASNAKIYLHEWAWHSWPGSMYYIPVQGRWRWIDSARCELWNPTRVPSEAVILQYHTCCVLYLQCFIQALATESDHISIWCDRMHCIIDSIL